MSVSEPQKLFPSWRVERKVILVSVAMLALLELGVRVLEPRLSGNVRHIRDLPQAALQLQQSPGPRYLFLGNSLTNNAVDLNAFTTALAARGATPGVAVKA